MEERKESDVSVKGHFLDLESYPRKAHFDYFRSLAYPYVSVTVNVDVTELVRYCKERDASFYLMFMHAAALAADAVPELRRRIHEEGIVEYEECPTSHIELLENGTYVYCTLHHHLANADYLSYAREEQRKAREQEELKEDEDVESMYFISTMPWLSYTSLTQPVAGGDESNPRITWGKYEADANGRLRMPLSILVHHGLVDGVHLAAFYKNVEEEMQKMVNG
ncbi:MAG: chloramphenicol acetyltransferase [Lachnospiraceae bacterium]|nr:chloramphenicol acetyltransferase [Lachnospiraceae bacterium]